jgi:hypothetical protein
MAIHLRARNRSDASIASYRNVARALGDFLIARAMPAAVDRITCEHMEAIVVDWPTAGCGAHLGEH